MSWWLVITIVVAAALAYGYWSHRGESRRLRELFAPLAAKYQGELTPGSLLVLPQLRFEVNNRRYLLTAMATSGDQGGGPFTFVELELPFDTGQRIRVRRGAGVDGPLRDAVGLGRRLTTGDREFDGAFRTEGRDQVFASSLLEPAVRRRLLESRSPRLEVRLEGPKIVAHTDGIAESKADLQELIDIAALLADHCPTSP